MAARKKYFKGFTKREKIILFLKIVAIILGANVIININHPTMSNLTLNDSVACQGENNDCAKEKNYITITQEKKEVYVSPEKRLIKPNSSDYSFTLKIVNEKNEDINDVALAYFIPADYGDERIIIEPKDKTERITKYNGLVQISQVGLGWRQGDKLVHVYDIESIYKKDTKEYEVRVNTRGYDKDIFIEFGIINLTEYPSLREMFKEAGSEYK